MDKKLLCGNEVVESIKRHSLVELKLFYNMIYYYKAQEQFGEYDEDYNGEENYIPLDRLKIILGKKLSEGMIIDLIEGIPREIKLKRYAGCKTGFVSIYSYVFYDTLQQCLFYKLNEDFIDLIGETISHFTELELNEFATLRSTYSQRLYELYKQYVGADGKIGQGNYNMTRKYFYDYFNVSEETNISEVIRIGIDKGIEELKNKCNYYIEYEKKKKGNKITHIHFKFRQGA